MLKITLLKHEFVYVIEMSLGLCSESCCHLGKEEIEERRKMIEEWIKN